MKSQNKNAFIRLLIFTALITIVTSPCSAVNGIQYYTQADGTTCAPTCPSTTYKNNNDFVCTACDGSCNGCTSSATNCNSCASSYFRVIGSTACTNDCGNGYYKNTVTNTCTVCPIGCKLCTLSTSLECS